MATALIPHLIVNDGSAAIAYYIAALGATEVRRVVAEDGKRLMHAHLHIDGLDFFLCDEFPEFGREGFQHASAKTLGGSPVTLHLCVTNCDESYHRAVAAGGTGKSPPWDAFWGDRYAKVVDPFGHEWSFSHPLAGSAGVG